MEEYFVIKGQNPGPTTVIMAGVHGNETCGVKAVETVIPLLMEKVSKGRVIFLLGNPLAVAQGKRFIDVNLNRMFAPSGEISFHHRNSYEFHRAKFLMSALKQADALLDIHSTTNPSEPFMISDHPEVFERTVDLPCDFSRIVSGLDALHPGSSDGFMNQIGKLGVCIECGQHENPEAFQLAKRSIFRFLQNMGNIELPKARKMVRIDRQEIFAESIYHTKTGTFRLAHPFSDFATVKPTQYIARDGDDIIRAEKEGFILFAVNREKIGDEGFVFATESKPRKPFVYRL